MLCVLTANAGMELQNTITQSAKIWLALNCFCALNMTRGVRVLKGMAGSEKEIKRTRQSNHGN